ncbi:Calcineurin-like phosphoesterase [Limihaloglobus sulfuriphilus]|uniref:Calcineurin-like phosphoesterase n=1 Tax=Limihaloglobus sulfuriphilus TaxID=1851148 RepID=A0A1Q2MAG8_9BACT|nr:metallophosphoesterase [Limihaloglobus sulfuriphilus]AQQ69681.1 Calcineurin-like phosphoesterase [Limihaloglobus sulfuriphilus]
MADNNLTRRNFISAAGAATASLTGINTALASNRSAAVQSSLLAQAAARGEKPNPGSGTLKGFIVSDVHFGWKHPAQPSNVMIAQNIGNILERFDELDVFLDTGDIHHGDSGDQGRADFTQFEQSALKQLPFYVAGGNHETIGYRGAECEARTMQLCSITCRPYYSIDIKGVHLVFLPELMAANLITAESLEWLRLDLELNKDKTTLILTHNSIKDTTRYWDSITYRRVANSEEVLNIINSYSNVIGWMHGHNHTWEIEEKFGKYFVSNGRIGGFSPPFPNDNVGDGLLGGIYFEISPQSFTVRGYCSNKQCFLDELKGYEHMTRTMKLRTSVDENAPFAHSWGMGGARSGLITPAYNHHLPGEDSVQELFIAGCSSPVFSENSNLDITAEQPEGWSKSKSVSGLAVSPTKDVAGEVDGIRFLNPGIELLPLGGGNDTRSLFSPSTGNGAGYYRCVPGKTYQAQITASGKSDVKCTLEFHVYDSDKKKLHSEKAAAVSLKGSGRTTIKASCKIPESAAKNSIYSDSQREGCVNLVVQAKFENLTSPVQVHEFNIRGAAASGQTRDASVVIAGKTYKHRGAVSTEPARLALDSQIQSRDAVRVDAGGNERLSWLIRQTGLAWQVRNAPASVQKDASVKIGPMRNTYNDLDEIIIVPLKSPQTPYVHRMRGIDSCRIEPYDPVKKELRIHVDKVIGDYQQMLVLNAPGSPRVWENCKHRNVGTYRPDIVGFQVAGEGTVVIGF